MALNKKALFSEGRFFFVSLSYWRVNCCEGRVVKLEVDPRHLQFRLSNRLYEYGYYVRVSGAVQKKG